MKKIIAMILTLALMLSMGACAANGDQNQNNDTTAAGNSTQAPEGTTAAQVEQTLNLVYPASNNINNYDFVDPWRDTTLVNNLLWMTLIQADENLKAAEPEIMKSWEVTDGGLTITMTMRDDLLWSDGTPMTMDDVVWTLERFCGPIALWSYVVEATKYIEGQAAFANGETDHVSGITAEGNTLTIKLTQPFTSFLDLMCQVVVLPKHIYGDIDHATFSTDAIWESVKVNSGMYVVTEHVPHNYFVLEPNPNYKGGETPKITKIINTVASNNVVVAQSNAVDFLASTSLDEYEVLQTLDSYRMEIVPIVFYRFLVFNFFNGDNSARPWMQDVRVREAVAKAVDWQTVIGGLFGDQVSFTQTGVLSNDANYAGDWYEYDPDGAKQLLQDAGYDFNHKMKIMYYYSDQASVDLMDAIAYYLGEIGVQVEAVYTNNSSSDIYGLRDHDIAYFGLSAFDNLSWYQMYMRDSMNLFFSAQDMFGEEVKKLEAAYNADLLSAALAKLQQMDKENIFFLPLYTMNQNVWVHESLSIPENAQGNTKFYYDYQFENWEKIG